MNKYSMNHGIAVKIESIENFEIKLENAKKNNWKINNIIRDTGKGKFENLSEYTQELIINYIKKEEILHEMSETPRSDPENQ